MKESPLIKSLFESLMKGMVSTQAYEHFCRVKEITEMDSARIMKILEYGTMELLEWQILSLKTEEDEIEYLKEKEIKLLQELNVTRNAIKYQTERLKTK